MWAAICDWSHPGHLAGISKSREEAAANILAKDAEYNTSPGKQVAESQMSPRALMNMEVSRRIA